ncbi:uncharacterized protein LOC134722333 [Mytilus trossulus]|uniref:uncharacterized protein LOC134722333 n=1 Tax=Mytilus trossulus TaxID=6551 RepID=UPI003006222B
MTTVQVVVALCFIFNLELGIAKLTAQSTTEATTPSPSTVNMTPAPTTVTMTSTPPPTPPPFHQGPQYTINCLETGNVEVKGVSTTSTLIVNHNQTCAENKTKYTASSSGKITIHKSCLTVTNLTATRSVTFTIHDETFDGKIRPNPLTTVVGLNGGQSQHTITVHCTPLPGRGIQVYVVHGVGLATLKPKNIPTEIEKVEMRLKSEKYDSYDDVTKLPDVSTVYIGDKFYMYLVYLGKDQYSVIPTDCKAFDGAYASEPSASVKKLNLYTKSCLTQNAKDYRVMHPFSLAMKNDTRILSAEIYGFMFNTDNEITFVCTIKICKTSTPCVSAACNGTDWSSSRKRRRAPEDKELTITKRLRVQMKTVQSSAGFTEYSCFCIILLQLFIQMG